MRQQCSDSISCYQLVAAVTQYFHDMRHGSPKFVIGNKGTFGNCDFEVFVI